MQTAVSVYPSGARRRLLGGAIFTEDLTADGDDNVPEISPGQHGSAHPPARERRALAERRRFPNRRTGEERRIGDRRQIFLPVRHDRRIGLDHRHLDDRRRGSDRRTWIERRARIHS